MFRAGLGHLEPRLQVRFGSGVEVLRREVSRRWPLDWHVVMGPDFHMWHVNMMTHIRVQRLVASGL